MAGGAPAERGLGGGAPTGGGDAATAAAAIAAVPVVALEPAPAAAPALEPDSQRAADAGGTPPLPPVAVEPLPVSADGAAAGELSPPVVEAPGAATSASPPTKPAPLSLSPPPAADASTATVSPSHCASAAAAGAPCVLDLGFNTGQDSHFYLADGYTVVGVDANPDLIAAGRTRFADATAKGKLTLVSNGLVGEVAEGKTAPETLRFYRSKLRSEWSSFDASWGCRNPNNTPVDKEVPAHCERIDVPVTTCAGLIERFGKPLYMKVRHEGGGFHGVRMSIGSGWRAQEGGAHRRVPELWDGRVVVARGDRGLLVLGLFWVWRRVLWARNPWAATDVLSTALPVLFLVVVTCVLVVPFPPPAPD